MVSVTKLFPVLAMGYVASAGSAPVATDSPKDAHYVAKFSKTISGEVNFETADNGTVSVNVDLSGLPSTGGPFAYHVHQKPVPSDGNCTGTLLHLNPYGGNPNNTKPSEKEVGDLAGRHGKLTSSDGKASYDDDFISLNSKDPAYIGGLSVVVHFANDSRLACANITEVNAGSGFNSSSNSSSSSSSSSSSASAVENGSGLNLASTSVLTAAMLVLGSLL